MRFVPVLDDRDGRTCVDPNVFFKARNFSRFNDLYLLVPLPCVRHYMSIIMAIMAPLSQVHFNGYSKTDRKA